MAKIKSLFAEKRVEEAVKILHEQYKQLLKNDSDRRDLSRWLSLFQLDDTMVSYEKALGFAESKPDEADSEFKRALALEPYNKALITQYLSFLIGTEQLRAAQEFSKGKLLEQPYMNIYKVYSIHSEALLAQKTVGPTCENRDFDEIEQTYCYLVQLIVKVSFADAQTPLEASALRSLVKKIKLPDAHYWVWKARGDQEEIKKYVSLCQSLSPKDKKIYKMIPGVCSKLEDARKILKTNI